MENQGRQGREEVMNQDKTIRVLITAAVGVMFLGLLACTTVPLSKSEKAQEQDSVRDMVSQTLAQLYKTHPAARDVIAKSAGYAVFSDFGFKAIFMGGAGGKGLAVDNATKQETFMKMAEFQPGLGLGAARFRLVFIFDTPEAFNNFVASGWEAGANAMAAAKTRTEGGALAGVVTVSKGVRMIQLDDKGLIVGVSLTAAKFYKDKELN
jgi:lipid-binding SYLF domain-containing protein